MSGSINGRIVIISAYKIAAFNHYIPFNVQHQSAVSSFIVCGLVCITFSNKRAAALNGDSSALGNRNHFLGSNIIIAQIDCNIFIDI